MIRVIHDRYIFHLSFCRWFVCLKSMQLLLLLRCFKFSVVYEIFEIFHICTQSAVILASLRWSTFRNDAVNSSLALRSAIFSYSVRTFRLCILCILLNNFSNFSIRRFFIQLLNVSDNIAQNCTNEVLFHWVWGIFTAAVQIVCHFSFPFLLQLRLKNQLNFIPLSSTVLAYFFLTVWHERTVFVAVFLVWKSFSCSHLSAT